MEDEPGGAPNLALRNQSEKSQAGRRPEQKEASPAEEEDYPLITPISGVMRGQKPKIWLKTSRSWKLRSSLQHLAFVL